MKNIINKIWILFLVLALVCGGSAAYKYYLNEKKELQELNAHQIASTVYNLEKKYTQQLIDSSKVIQDYRHELNKKLKVSIKCKTKYVDSLVYIAKLDTNTTGLCDSAINAQSELIFDLNRFIYNDSVIIAESEKQNAFKDSILNKCENNLAVQNKINTDLQKQVKRNFIEKNGLLVGGGSVLAIFAIFKFIK